MSEEEIIGRLKKIIKIAYSKEFNIFELKYQDVDAIQGLLDLYKAEKEKNKNLLEQLKDSEKELLEVTKKFISKDKIREILKDLEEFDTKFFDAETLKLVTKNTLENLLKEN